MTETWQPCFKPLFKDQHCFTEKRHSSVFVQGGVSLIRALTKCLFFLTDLPHGLVDNAELLSVPVANESGEAAGEAGYLAQAANELNAALEREKDGDFSTAILQYRTAVDILIKGVHGESERREREGKREGEREGERARENERGEEGGRERMREGKRGRVKEREREKMSEGKREGERE